ncbi:enoyl-CoA hydratase/isomerase family protein [Thermodesulfobacteriota bacterium]
MEFENIILEKKNNYAKITLNRPKALNALSSGLMLEMQAAIREVESDEEVRAVIITGSGRAFCTGGDLEEQKTLGGDPRKIGWWLKVIKESFMVIYRCTKPTVAMVNGIALAGGIELILLCDLAIVAEEVKIGDQHINYGLMGGFCSVPMLPRIIGVKKGKELLLTGDWITGRAAERIGLVNKSVPADKLEEATIEFVGRLTNKSPLLLKATKDLVNRTLELDLDDAVEMGLLATTDLLHTGEDVKEGWAAFSEKRKPVWKGR